MVFPRPGASRSMDAFLSFKIRRAKMPAAPASSTRYRRVILKLSGESFVHAGERGIHMDEVALIARQAMRASQLGVQVGIVIGGGNILRGAQFKADSGSNVQEATAHYMGMLATVINGLALQDALEGLGCDTRLMSSLRVDGVAEPYIRRRARRHLEKNASSFSPADGQLLSSPPTRQPPESVGTDADIVPQPRGSMAFTATTPRKPHAVLLPQAQLSNRVGAEAGR